MSSSWIGFLCYTLIAVAIQGLFAFFEMACISFNRVRLQYYLSQGKKRAIWLNYLLTRPSRLFGTTLIGLNASLQIGSECSRRFYESIHLDPDWAPLSQVVIVMIFGELVPLFTARRHPEQAAMALVPFMVLLARLLSPITWTFDALSYCMHRLLGKPKEAPLFLSREEVKMAFEEKAAGEDDFNRIASQIFQLKNRTAEGIMTPLSRTQTAPSSATLADVRHLLSVHYAPFIPIYHRYPHNIVAIAYLRDLLRIEEGRRVLEHARSPWFVAKEASILDILDQFRRNNQSVAIILDPSGKSCGLLTLDDIVSQIFGAEESLPPSPISPTLHIERTLFGDMDVADFNRQFQASLPSAPGDTLSDFLLRHLDHLPVKEETIQIDGYLFTILEPSMRGVKMLSIRSVQD